MNNSQKSIRTICSVVTLSFTLMMAPVHAAEISQSALVNKLAKTNKPLILDVRTAEEFNQGHIPGAINISHTELAERLNEVSDHKNSEIVLYCRSGRRVAIADQILTANGFNELNHLEGDYLAWSENDMTIVK